MTTTYDLTRHVRTQKGVERYHLPIGTPLDGSAAATLREKARTAYLSGDKSGSAKMLKAAAAVQKIADKEPTSRTTSSVNKDLEGLPNPAKVKLNGKDYDLDSAAKMVASAYDWHSRDRGEGTVKTSVGKASVYEQNKAQVVAKAWASGISSDSPEADQYAASLWDEYQQAQLYGRINGILRGTIKPEKGDPPKADLEKYVNRMFVQGGYTTQQPMRLYRALKSKRASSFEPGNDSGTEDWASKLKPGTTFSDSGIVSSTAHKRFSQGWLTMGGQSAGGDDFRDVQPNDVVVEMRLPAGQRIVGGDPQFIETMLPPGTTFKVISAEPKTATGISPITNDKEKMTYTHVVAEVVPE